MTLQRFTTLAIVTFTAVTSTPTWGSGLDRSIPAIAVDDGGGQMPHGAPERPGAQPSEIPRSHMDPGMQHFQEGHPDPRASQAPRNLDPTMSTNPDVDPSVRQDRQGRGRSAPDSDQRLQ